MSYLLLCSALKLLDLPTDMSPEPPFLCLDQDLLCLPRILLSVYLLGTIVLYSKTCLFYHPFVFLSQSIVQVGTEVEFALTSVNVVGKPSDRSESSPVYRVIGRCNSRSFMLYGNSKEITIQCLNVLSMPKDKYQKCEGCHFHNAKETDGKKTKDMLCRCGSLVCQMKKGTFYFPTKSADKPKPPGICLAREEEVMIDGGRNCIR